MAHHIDMTNNRANIWHQLGHKMEAVHDMMRRKIIMPIVGHSFHSKSNAELRYIIKDAGEAAVAMRGHDCHAECKYLDQVNDAATILHYRGESAA